MLQGRRALLECMGNEFQNPRWAFEVWAGKPGSIHKGSQSQLPGAGLVAPEI